MSTQIEAPEDIAVVGLACLYPGAPDVAAFWRNILAKVDAITDPPAEAWNADLYHDVQATENDRVYCKKGGYLGRLAYFDPLEHGIMPRAVEGGEPDQWLALRVARQALKDAGYADVSAYRERAALILGKGTYANRGTLSVVQHALIVDHTLDVLKAVQPNLTDEDLQLIRADLKRRLPRFDAETAPALIPNVTAGRIANRLDLMGPSYTVDAACASSLVAIDIAVKGLRHGEYDLAIVGGMQVATPMPVLSLFCQLRALSAGQTIRPFDKDADGTLLSEGLGMAVLKRRSQAERDGDRIYACIKGTGVASDGRAVSVLAPRVEGEELALRRAYEAARIEPQTVGLIEAHGTATLVGDAVELEALTRVFGERKRPPRCAIGSVKSMIGHTMPAAGMAGFIKAVLSLYHKVLPPTLNVSAPSPRLGLERTPFYINTETRPWIHGETGHLRRAGVNAFGFGGINAHVMVEEVPERTDVPTYDTSWDSELCLVRGRDRSELQRAAKRLAELIAKDPDLPLAGIARTLNTAPPDPGGAGAPESTLAIVAQSTADLARKLDRAMTRLADPSCRKIKETGGIYYFDEPLGRSGKLAFVFPGEGAQYVNMLADICRHFPVARAAFDAMDRVLSKQARGYVLSDFVFPPPAFTAAERTAAEKRLWQMDIAIEAVIAANQALYGVLRELGITPDVILGHSSGECSAMRATGMLDETHYDEWVVEMNEIYERTIASGNLPVQYRLIAVGAAREPVEALCASLGLDVCVAMDNCRHQVVLVADLTTAATLEIKLREAGLLYEVLSFDRPYHTPYFEEFAQALRRILNAWIVRPPAMPLYSCTSVALYPSNLADAHQLAFDHWVRPVEFRQTIEKMWTEGVRIFVESGPRGNLTAFIDDILAGRSFAAVPANVSRRTGLTQLHHLLAQLGAHGVPMTLEPLYNRRGISTIALDGDRTKPAAARMLGRVKLPTGAAEMRLSPEIVALVRSRGRSADVQVPAPPLSPVSPEAESVSEPAVSNDAVAVDVSRTPEVMSAFLRTMGRLLDIEQDVVGSALDGHPLDAGIPGAETTGAGALIHVVSVAGSQSLVARCTLDLNEHPFLRDHTLGRDVSADDPLLTGFPIVPFTAFMELMAEAAVALTPGDVVIGMRDVRVHRWVAVDRGPVTLELSAERNGDGRVTVAVVDVDARDAGPVAEGVILLGSAYPDAPSGEPITLAAETSSKFPPARLYRDAMFHGPLFRGVESMDRLGDNGADATVRVVPRDELLAFDRPPQLATDFVLLDQPGQIVGFWAAQYLREAYVVLPNRLERLDLYGPLLPAGERLFSRASIATIGDRRLRSDLDLVREDGRLWARFEGWEDRRFDLPPAAFERLLDPSGGTLSQRWRLLDDRIDRDRAVAFRIGLDTFPPGWLHAHGGMWARVLAAGFLSGRERAVWHAMRTPERRRLEWLLGRIAAKDAVREYLRRHHGLTLHPADVEILPDAAGRPVVSGAWTARAAAPLVSISHVDGAAVALATSGALSGLGIDLERCGRMKAGMEEMAFTAGERELLARYAGDERQAWALRLWCAKEAAAKATGCAVGPTSSSLAVERIHHEQGTVALRYAAAGGDTIAVVASTAREGEWVAAACLAEQLVATGGARS